MLTLPGDNEGNRTCRGQADEVTAACFQLKACWRMHPALKRLGKASNPWESICEMTSEPGRCCHKLYPPLRCASGKRSSSSIKEELKARYPSLRLTASMIAHEIRSPVEPAPEGMAAWPIAVTIDSTHHTATGFAGIYGKRIAYIALPEELILHRKISQQNDSTPEGCACRPTSLTPATAALPSATPH